MVKFTEAASLALHAMALLAAERERRFQIHDIADALPGSTSHLAKVLQRLAKVGLITSVRGRGGGFVLAGDPAQTTMLEVYEAIEGRLDVRGCAFPNPQCSGDCIFGDALGAASRLIRERLAHTRLSELHTVLPAGSPARLPRRARRQRPRA